MCKMVCIVGMFALASSAVTATNPSHVLGFGMNVPVTVGGAVIGSTTVPTFGFILAR